MKEIGKKCVWGAEKNYLGGFHVWLQNSIIQNSLLLAGMSRNIVIDYSIKIMLFIILCPHVHMHIYNLII